MMTHANIDTGPPSDTAARYDDTAFDRQRSGTGLLNFLLFPLISMAAIAFAAFELVR